METIGGRKWHNSELDLHRRAITLTATVGGVPVEVKCEKESDTSELTGGEPITGKASMEFTSCSAGGLTVKEPIKITSAKIEVVSESGKLYYKISPNSGTVLTTIVLKECNTESTYELTGTARSEIGAEDSTFGTGTGFKLELKKGASTGAATFVGKITEKMTPTEEEVEEERFEIRE